MLFEGAVINSERFAMARACGTLLILLAKWLSKLILFWLKAKYYLGWQGCVVCM